MFCDFFFFVFFVSKRGEEEEKDEHFLEREEKRVRESNVVFAVILWLFFSFLFSFVKKESKRKL